MPLKLIFAIETSNFGDQVQPRWSALFLKTLFYSAFVWSMSAKERRPFSTKFCFNHFFTKLQQFIFNFRMLQILCVTCVSLKFIYACTNSTDQVELTRKRQAVYCNSPF